jgi:hypothetical protein
MCCLILVDHFFFRFVKVSVACDAIFAKVLANRKSTALAMLGTPTDVYVIPEAARRFEKAMFVSEKKKKKLGAMVSKTLFVFCFNGFVSSSF